MTVCPIAIVAGCKKCPVFSVCPAKSILGDQVAEDKSADKVTPAKKTAAKK
jgi:hypothetical protein